MFKKNDFPDLYVFEFFSEAKANPHIESLLFPRIPFARFQWKVTVPSLTHQLLKQMCQLERWISASFVHISGCSNLSWQINMRGRLEIPREWDLSPSWMKSSITWIGSEYLWNVFVNLGSHQIFRYIKSLITFTSDLRTNVVNLSRFDPNALILKGLKGGNNEKYQYICHKTQPKPALCISVGIITEDRSKELVRNGSGVGSKFVAAIPLSYEYKRWVATIAMTLGARSFKSQITDNKLVFSTRPETKGGVSRCKSYISITMILHSSIQSYNNARQGKISSDNIQTESCHCEEFQLQRRSLPLRSSA